MKFSRLSSVFVILALVAPSLGAEEENGIIEVQSVPEGGAV